MTDAPKKEARRAEETSPRFAAEFPKDPRLQELVLAFTRGDYRAVNDGVDELLEKNKDVVVQAAARELKDRTRPHPLAKYMFLLAVLLLAVLASYWVTESQRPHVEPKTASAASASAKPQVLMTTPASAASNASPSNAGPSSAPASSK